MFFGIWFFQYFIGYIQGTSIVVLLIGLILWVVLLGIALYQVVKLEVENTKHYSRLIFITIILILNLLSLAKQAGIINWEKYEGENILVAQMEGTANCQTVLKLKSDNRFENISYCFGREFHYGTYKFKNDTLYFELDKNVGYMDKSSYAVLRRSTKDTTK